MVRKSYVFLIITVILLAGLALWRWQPQSPVSAGTGLILEASPQLIIDHIRSLNSPLVLVNFWASWCEPCKEEFPNLLLLRKKFAAQGLQVVFISIDEPRDLLAAENFLRENHVEFQTYYKGTQNLHFVSQLYPQWEGAVPTTVLFGRNLKIVDAWEGDATLNEFETRVLKHLRGS